MNCPVCNAWNQDDSRYCTACGQSLETSGQYDVSGGGDPGPYESPYTRSQREDPQFFPPASPLPQQNIPNYLPQAILVTICCCLPAGIVSIVYAAQVNGKITRGDVEGALSSSNNARTWAWVAFGLGILAGIISGVANLAGV